MRFFTIILLYLSPVSIGFAQDSLLLLSGKYIKGDMTYEDQDRIFIAIKKSEKKEKILNYSKKDVFSIQQEKKQKRVIYKKDISSRHYLTKDEMYMFIKGEQDALRNYKIGYHFLVGCALGLTGSLIDTYEFENTDCKGYFNNSASLTSILTPFAVSVVIGFPNKKVRKAFVSDKVYLSDEHYKLGFNQVKVFRKTLFSFLGSLSGVATVLTISFIHQDKHSCP